MADQPITVQARLWLEAEEEITKQRLRTDLTQEALKEANGHTRKRKKEVLEQAKKDDESLKELEVQHQQIKEDFKARQQQALDKDQQYIELLSQSGELKEQLKQEQEALQTLAEQNRAQGAQLIRQIANEQQTLALE